MMRISININTNKQSTSCHDSSIKLINISNLLTSSVLWWQKGIQFAKSCVSEMSKSQSSYSSCSTEYLDNSSICNKYVIFQN